MFGKPQKPTKREDQARGAKPKTGWSSRLSAHRGGIQLSKAAVLPRVTQSWMVPHGPPPGPQGQLAVFEAHVHLFLKFRQQASSWHAQGCPRWLSLFRTPTLREPGSPGRGVLLAQSRSWLVQRPHVCGSDTGACACAEPDLMKVVWLCVCTSVCILLSSRVSLCTGWPYVIAHVHVVCLCPVHVCA